MFDLNGSPTDGIKGILAGNWTGGISNFIESGLTTSDVTRPFSFFYATTTNASNALAGVVTSQFYWDDMLRQARN